MKQFNETIIVNGEPLSFQFSRIHTTKGEKFFISAVKDRGYFVFDMQKDDSGKWKIGVPAPQWVEPILDKLAEVINRNSLD